MAPARPKPSSSATRRRSPVVPIDLALQGGGSHGAFTWGVLDALLADERLKPDGISGTSAGAINAAVLASGYAQGGAAGARASLASFWGALGGMAEGWTALKPGH